MNNLSQMNEVDALLRRFYHAEMPDPWPAPPMPAEAPRLLPMPRQSARWHSPRLAMAAAVALVLTGYLLFTSAFPTGSPTTVPQGPKDLIGSKDLRPKTPGTNYVPQPLEFVPLGKGRKAEIQSYRSTESGQPTILYLRESK